MKRFLIATAIGLLGFVCVCWTLANPVYGAAWAESVLFFGLAYYLIDLWGKADEKNGKTSCARCAAVWGLIVGRLLPQIVVLAIDFHSSVYSLYFAIVSVAGIILGAICAGNRRASSFLMAYVILLLLNTVAIHGWDLLLNH